MRFALLLFILVPVIEVIILIKVGSSIGAWLTIGLVCLTAILGVIFIRQQGLETSMQAQAKMRQGELPASEVAEGIMLLFAGFCLLIPGFVTDAIGAILLIRPVSKLVAAGLFVNCIASMVKRGSQWTSYNRQYFQRKGDVFDGEYSKESKEDPDFIDKK